ncbi:MAG: hypothetical protein M1826_007106 [Phylliscum demangeonii]|nr:MAG: hypothetical protein M1826_007106 [Phylliscum demangeonii]
MSARIQLDRPHAHFTNLDYISGQVVLNLSSDEAISSILVKLEGESKTRLARPKTAYAEGQNSSKKTELEVHKILYKVEEVFPSGEIKKQTSSTAGYTLPGGQHVYPFRFKIPFNNNCPTSNSLFSSVNFSGVRMEIARDTDKHVKNSLPPSLTGFPGEAEIRYFVKATVVRPRFYQENHRAVSEFTFLPIEPPRPPDSGQETYARRQHQFPTGALAPRKKGLLAAFRPPSPPPPDVVAPLFSVDVRLPNPSIATCNEALPIRVLVKRLSACLGAVYLQTLQIELLGFTKVRAHELQRTEYGSWVIVSLSNMGVKLGGPADAAGTEVVVDDVHWRNKPLPSTVAPSFVTCNITRTYQLEVRVGLAYGSETILLPLRHPISVFSGISPPPALLAKMAQRGVPYAELSVNTNLAAGPAAAAAGAGLSPTPMTPSYAQDLHPPPRLGEVHTPLTAAAGANANAKPELAPPSYEDAMAEDVAPVDGHRRHYSMQPVARGRAAADDDGNGHGVGGGGGGGGEKAADGFRPDAERLFPDSQPGEAPFGSTTAAAGVGGGGGGGAGAGRD